MEVLVACRSKAHFKFSSSQRGLTEHKSMIIKV